VSVTGSDDVASRWEVIKRDEKGRTSVTDGIAWQLPALSLYAKLLRKAQYVDVTHVNGDEARARALVALESLRFDDDGASDAQSTSDVDVAWGDLLTAILSCAQWSGVDLEGVLRERAQMLRDALLIAESRTNG
jgi:uncharacterized protein YabN with tetrapyrrole methylase and pyrophosphatase domain